MTLEPGAPEGATEERREQPHASLTSIISEDDFVKPLGEAARAWLAAEGEEWSAERRHRIEAGLRGVLEVHPGREELDSEEVQRHAEGEVPSGGPSRGVDPGDPPHEHR